MQLKIWQWDQDNSGFESFVYFQELSTVLNNLENLIDITQMLQVSINIDISHVDPITRM